MEITASSGEEDPVSVGAKEVRCAQWCRAEMEVCEEWVRIRWMWRDVIEGKES